MKEVDISGPKKKLDEVSEKIRLLCCPATIKTDVDLPNYSKTATKHCKDQVHGDIVYVDNCLRHAQRELLEVFNNAVANCPEPGWCFRDCKPYEVKAEGVADKMLLKSAHCLRRHVDVANLADLKGSLVIYRSHLFYASKKGMSCGCTKNQVIMRGKCFKHREAVPILIMLKLQDMLNYPDKSANCHDKKDNMMYSLGTCDNLVKCILFLDCVRDSKEDYENKVLSLLRDPASALLRSSAELSVYRDVNSQLPQSSSLFNSLEDKIELRTEQKEVIYSLKSSIEFIKGPPGTGKSTIIKSAMRHCIPHANDDITVLLSVQNKAINVLVQMLVGSVDSERMLVIGSSNNLNMGETASECTIYSHLDRLPEDSKYKLAQGDLDKCSDDIGNATARKNAIGSRLLEELKSLKKKKEKMLDEATDEAIEAIYKNVRIVLSTFTELHKLVAGNGKGPVDLNCRIKSVVVDEAGNVPEYEAAIISGLTSA